MPSTSLNSKTASAKESGRALTSPNRPYPDSSSFYRPKSIYGRTSAGTAHREDWLQSMICTSVPMAIRQLPNHGFYMYGGISSMHHFPVWVTTDDMSAVEGKESMHIPQCHDIHDCNDGPWAWDSRCPASMAAAITGIWGGCQQPGSSHPVFWMEAGEVE